MPMGHDKSPPTACSAITLSEVIYIGDERDIDCVRVSVVKLHLSLDIGQFVGIEDFGATRKSRMCSCKNSRKEALTWGSAPKCPTRLNQVRLGQCSRVHKDGDRSVRQDHDCQHQAVRS